MADRPHVRPLLLKVVVVEVASVVLIQIEEERFNNLNTICEEGGEEC